MDAIRQAMAQEVVRLQRKLAASEKERDALAAHVVALHGFLKTAPIGNGVCCCGDDISTHASSISCGHCPVDEVEYAAQLMIEEAPTTSLTRHDDELRVDTLAEVLALARTMGSDELIRELEYQGAELRRRLDDETDRAR